MAPLRLREHSMGEWSNNGDPRDSAPRRSSRVAGGGHPPAPSTSTRPAGQVLTRAFSDDGPKRSWPIRTTEHRAPNG
jgi:hypothetical protein